MRVAADVSGGSARKGEGPHGPRQIHLSRALVALSAAMMLAFPSTAVAAAGDLDTTFNDDGRVLTDFGLRRPDRGEGVAVGPDGKVVVAGWTTAGIDGQDVDFGLVRYDRNGVPDPGFGAQGLVTTDFPVPSGAPDSHDSGRDVAISDGRVVVAGISSRTVSAVAVAVYRYADGALDTTFSGDGVVRIGIPDLVDVGGVAVQPDGKIVVAGRVAQDFVVVRLRPGGRPDPTFDGDGFVITDLTPWDEGTDVTIQPDGRIVVVGTVSDPFTAASGFGLVRYTSNGALDSSLSQDGVQTTMFASGGIANGVALAPDGKIVVTGMIILEGTQDLLVVRYRRNGSLDRDTATRTGFSRDGRDRVNFGSRDVGEAVIVQTDGRIVAVGNSGGNWAIARFLTAGGLDPSFSGNGKLTHPMGEATLDIAKGVAIAPDGRIVAGGFGGRDFAAARYLAG